MDDIFGDVAFEAQIEPRGCGAACLAMVFRALGRPVSQAAIWPRIARRNARGSMASTTHLMARDAAERGFEAVAVQARDKLGTLRACSDAGAHAIVAIRHAADDASGHYAVLLDVDSACVRLHDPYAGPRRILSHAGLLSLWDERPGEVEVTGGMLVAVAAPAAEAPACTLCRTPVPESVGCPRCGADVGLRPLAAIGCLSAACPARLWERVCCPECDLLWDASAQPAAAAEPPEPGPDPAKMFAALDAFARATSSVRGAASHPELTALLGSLAGMRAKVEAALAADLSTRAELAAQLQATAAAVAAHRKARPPSPPPPAPVVEPKRLELDPASLGRALLERLAA